MTKYFCPLLAICLASSSLLFSNVSFAQTASDEIKLKDKIVTTTKETTSIKKPAQAEVKKKSVIASDGKNKAVIANSKKPNLNINPRIPIMSRIFAAPTMQQ